MKVEIGVGIRSYFHGIKVISPNEVREFPDAHGNLITDQGLARMKNAFGFSRLIASTNMEEPSPSMVWVSGVLSDQGTRMNGWGHASNEWTWEERDGEYFALKKGTFQFPLGDVVGNVSTLGAIWGGNNSLFAAALIRDSEGDPTTITVLEDEILEVQYWQEYHFDPNFFEQTVVEVKGIPTTVTAQWAHIFGGWRIRLSNTNPATPYFGVSGWSYPGNMSTRAWPAGTPAFPVFSNSAIPTSGGTNFLNAERVEVPDPTKVVHRVSAETNQMNLSGGIEYTIHKITLTSSSTNDSSQDIEGYMQLHYDPPLDKTSDDLLTIETFISWGRYEDPEDED